jgi:hypothetical protein
MREAILAQWPAVVSDPKGIFDPAAKELWSEVIAIESEWFRQTACDPEGMRALVFHIG